MSLGRQNGQRPSFLLVVAAQVDLGAGSAIFAAELDFHNGSLGTRSGQ